MQVLYTILYILLFLVCLSTLIMIHELGHLMVAKAFKVYCFEYSIGFGPKLFSKKRKNGETAFSIRAIPFGGFVSMYGEDAEVPEGLEIPPERSIDGIKKYKKCLILVAGVTMNAILALVIFFICNTCFPVINYYANMVTVSETTIVTSGELKTDDIIDLGIIYKDPDNEKSDVLYYAPARNVVVSYDDSTTDTGVIGVLNRTLSNNHDLDWKYFLQFIKLDAENNIIKAYDLETDTKITQFDFDIDVFHLLDDGTYEQEATSISASLPVITNEKGKKELKETGISIYKESTWLGAKAFGQTFVDFGTSSTAIIKAFGSLFTSSEARESMGGIIAIGFESTNVLKNFGVNSFLRVWAMVSVNLAIVNLLPFPGLDGWQLLVTVVEGVGKKRIPDKVKNIVSLVGLILLFGLMILLVFKDVFKYII